MGEGLADNEAGEIILARHGRPALDRSQFMDWRGYREWWGLYEIGGLADGQRPLPVLEAFAASTDVIYSSALARSQETAQAIANGRSFEADPVFTEAPLPSPPIPFLRLTPGAWGVVARIAWWLGYSGGFESRTEAEQRADLAVDKLEAAARNGQTVLLCAHGWFNRMMRPVLLSRGWLCVDDHGDKHWSPRRYVRRNSPRA